MQAAFQQLRVRQARQDAEKAEETARVLESKANEAQQVADRAQENARELSAQSRQAQGIAGRARQGVAMMSGVEQMRAELFNTVSQASERQAATSASEDAAPVRNLSGQVTGTVVNTTA